MRREPRGRWSRFLIRQRELRGWTQREAFERLREGLHLGPESRTSYGNLERDTRQPTPDEAAFLARFYGAEPTDEPEAEPGVLTVVDLAPVVAAIDRQTAALTAFAEKLGTLLSAESGRSSEMNALVGALAKALLPRETIVELLRGLPAEPVTTQPEESA